MTAAPPMLRICLDPPMLASARAGRFNFLTQVQQAAQGAGWRVEWAPQDARAPQDGFGMFHMKHPGDGRSLLFRRAYHYPFWHIETEEKRWRWPVALARFQPDSIAAQPARDFAARLRQRVLPGPPPRHDGPVLIALQGRVGQTRSFQTMSPLQMVETVARSGLPAVVTLHPREVYTPADRAALDRIAAAHPNLTIGGDSTRLLRDCRFVVTQNSAVAFDGYLLEKPAVLFGQVDFHHIALNVAEMGARDALAAAAGHRPDFARYLAWFLRDQSIDAMAPDAQDRIRAAMRRGGWPI